MRVLHLCAGNLFGGVECTLLTLWRARGACPGMRPHFALCFDAKLAGMLRADGAPVTICGAVRMSRPWSVWRARRRLRDLLDANRFDVALAHGFWAQAVFGHTVRRAGVPLVTWAHDVPSQRDRWARRAARTPPDLLLASSRYTAARAATMFHRREVQVQYPPIRCAERFDRAGMRDQVRGSIGTPGDAFVVLIAARFQPGKGHEILIQALARLPEELPWECWIAGAAQRPGERVYRRGVERLIAAAGMERRVRWLGHRDDVPLLLRAADVMCQPNTMPEGFGLTFVEALAAGVAVVSSDLGAAPELIDQDCGLLVRPGDPAAVAEALRTIARSPAQSPSSAAAGEARARAGAGAGARAVERCNPERALPRLAGILKRAVAGAMVDACMR